MTEDILILYQELVDKLRQGQTLSTEDKLTMKTEGFLTYKNQFDSIDKSIEYSVLTDKLKVLKQHENQTYAKGKKLNLKWLSIAAIILLMLGTVFLFSNKENSYDSDLLIAEYFSAYPIDGNRGIEDQKEKAYQLYNDKKYAQAKILLQEISLKDKDLRHQFYLAICYMDEEDYTNAMKLLSIPEMQKAKKYPSKYYLALCYLANENHAKTIDLLNESMEYNFFIKEEATDLLSRIK